MAGPKKIKVEEEDLFEHRTTAAAQGNNLGKMIRDTMAASRQEVGENDRTKFAPLSNILLRHVVNRENTDFRKARQCLESSENGKTLITLFSDSKPGS